MFVAEFRGRISTWQTGHCSSYAACTYYICGSLHMRFLWHVLHSLGTMWLGGLAGTRDL